MAIYINTGYIINLSQGRSTQLPTGKVLHTLVGCELMRICKPERIDGFADYVSQKLNDSQLTVKKLG